MKFARVSESMMLFEKFFRPRELKTVHRAVNVLAGLTVVGPSKTENIVSQRCTTIGDIVQPVLRVFFWMGSFTINVIICN